MQDWRYYWTHHTYGYCLYSFDRGIFFVNIPKNSSSWTQQFLMMDCHWTQDNYHTFDLADKTALVVLRDPVDRWVSGITEYIVRTHGNEFDLDQASDQLKNWIVQKVVFDEHTEKQSMFVQGLDRTKTVFFYFDNNYTKNFLSYLASVGIHKTPNMPQPMNASNQDADKTRIAKQWHQLLEHKPDYVDHIKEFYLKDYFLIDSVPFFGDLAK